ncbi:MAG: hypothetical protein WC346_12900 [Methanogenium sp.]|jgi:polyferredoxin
MTKEKNKLKKNKLKPKKHKCFCGNICDCGATKKSDCMGCLACVRAELDAEVFDDIEVIEDSQDEEM